MYLYSMAKYFHGFWLVWALQPHIHPFPEISLTPIPPPRYQIPQRRFLLFAETPAGFTFWGFVLLRAGHLFGFWQTVIPTMTFTGDFFPQHLLHFCSSTKEARLSQRRKGSPFWEEKNTQLFSLLRFSQDQKKVHFKKTDLMAFHGNLNIQAQGRKLLISGCNHVSVSHLEVGQECLCHTHHKDYNFWTVQGCETFKETRPKKKQWHEHLPCILGQNPE